MEDPAWLVLSTFPDADVAREIATQLVTEKYAACANIVPAVESIYRWQDKIEIETETLVFFKTTAARFEAFREKLKTLHPYEVPEIIAVSIEAGSPEYLRWISASCDRP